MRGEYLKETMKEHTCTWSKMGQVGTLKKIACCWKYFLCFNFFCKKHSFFLLLTNKINFSLFIKSNWRGRWHPTILLKKREWLHPPKNEKKNRWRKKIIVKKIRWTWKNKDFEYLYMTSNVKTLPLPNNFNCLLTYVVLKLLNRIDSNGRTINCCRDALSGSLSFCDGRDHKNKKWSFNAYFSYKNWKPWFCFISNALPRKTEARKTRRGGTSIASDFLKYGFCCNIYFNSSLAAGWMGWTSNINWRRHRHT